jgi:ribose 5-phosphate isomerase B
MIYLGSDHRGFSLKEKIKIWLEDWGFKFQDMGAETYKKRDDFIDYALLVAEKVAKRDDSLGILVCRTGVGMDIAANKVNGVRSVLAISPEQVYQSKNDDHVNVLSLAVGYLSEPKLKKIVRFFLETEPSNEPRFLRRIEKIRQIEKED